VVAIYFTSIRSRSQIVTKKDLFNRRFTNLVQLLILPYQGGFYFLSPQQHFVVDSYG